MNLTNPLLELEDYPPFDGFPKEGFTFLRQLKRNNNREWFLDHQQEYESFVKLPMQSLIVSLRPHFARFAPEFDLNPKRSLFRIYRDVRFSSDKTPYKTHIAAHFVLRGTPKGFVGSGYYMEIAPGESYVGGGVYIPDGDQLKKIRKAIVAHDEEFLSIVENKKFQKIFAPFGWDTLKRIPKGFSEDHPMAAWLKCKQFFVGRAWTEAQAMQPRFVEDIADICEEISPLVQFLNSAF